MSAAATAEIRNLRGLHARAAANFARTASRFDARVTVSRGGETVDGSSIMGLLTLAAARGTEIRIEADGPEAEAAVAALRGLVEERFGEDR